MSTSHLPAGVPSLTLTSPQLLAALTDLEGDAVAASTLTSWARLGVLVPSVRHVGRRGRANVRLYSLSDLARARVIVRLRRAGLSMPKVRLVLAYLDTELTEVLRPRTTASLVVEPGGRAHIVRPGQADLEVPSGQWRLKLSAVVSGNVEAARQVRRHVA